MGVPIEVWVSVMRKNPLRFKFDGLGGFHTNVKSAAVADQRWCERRFEDYMDYEAREAWPEYAKDNGLDPDDRHDLELFLRGSAECFDIVQETDHLENHDQYLLAEHPPVEVFDAAYECGVEVEDVKWLCSGCGRQPIWRDSDGLHNSRYCGLCGCESAFNWNRGQGDHFDNFRASLDLALYPFVKFSTLREFVDRAVADNFHDLWRPVRDAAQLASETPVVEKDIRQVGDAQCNRFLLFKHDGKWCSLYLADDQME